MKQTDWDKFNNSMKAMQETYTPQKSVTSEKTLLYFDLFTKWEWTIEQFEQACGNLFQVKTISTFPLPAEIREALVLNKSLEAWLYTRKMVSRHGHPVSLIFEDHVIHSVIEAMGGWPEFGWVTDNQLTWKQKEFERLYNIMSGRGKHPAFVAGLNENSENLIDLKTGKQVEPDQAKLIITGKGQQDLLNQ